MFRNNFKIALRSLLKQKVYTFINVMGLAVGIASCLLIVLFVKSEFSYDKQFKDGDRIYRMVLERKYPNHSTFYAIIPQSFEETAKHDFAEIEASTNAFRFQNFTLTYKDEKGEEFNFDENAVLAADSNFLEVFNFTLSKGDPGTALNLPNQIVLSEEMAKRYFGDQDPIGKVLRAGQNEFKVTGVFVEEPNSHFDFRAMLSVSTFPFVRRENYTSFASYTYFKLKKGTDPNVLEAKIPTLVDKYAAAQIERNLGKSWEDYKKEGNGYRYFLQPLTSIHLDPLYLEAQMEPSGNINSVYIMISVAILILVIACINFMNLSTARSAERAREVGVRKVMGSFRKQLIAQFLTESFLLSAVGILLAIAIIYFSLPFFNELTSKQLALPFNVPSILILVVFTALVGALAGLYPSFVLSSFNPVVVMKGTFTGSKKGQWIRNGLVIFQFWISIALMIGTLVIHEQMKFLNEKQLGFDKEQMLVVERGFSLNRQQASTLIQELRQMPEVVNAAGSFAMPGNEGNFFGIQFQPEGSSEILTTKSMVISDDLAETLGLELLEGRWFSEETNDSLSVILNETAVKVMGLTDPVGRKLIDMQDGPNGAQIAVPFVVTGVVKDFNFISLRDEVTPLVIQSNEAFGGGNQFTVVRIKSGEISNALPKVEATWKKIAIGQPFKYFFLDQALDQQYKAEQQDGKLFGVFSGLAIFVACIGLFALSAYVTSLRTKEIGVRKVLGASVGGVVLLLSKDITRMVIMAFVLAVPVAWYLMENWWLQNFAYRIQVSIWMILTAGVSALLIAWLTVSYQSIKAAVRNPVKSLRYE